MKINDIVLEDGRIVPGVNTTDDVGPDEIKIQAKKMGFEVTKDGIPPLLYEEVDVENIHFQMMSEAINKDHTLYENLINTMFELKFGEIKSSTKHITETHKYAGNCVNSFDSGSGDCITSIFNDVSDFAVQEENAKIISKEEFDKYVSGYNLETSGNHEFQFYPERNIFALYDMDNDIHYFFSEQQELEEEALERQDVGMGLETFHNNDIAFVGGMRSGNSGPGETRLRYNIYDIASTIADHGEENVSEFIHDYEVGLLELYVQDGTGKIMGLVNIKITNPGNRKGGLGSAVVKSLLDSPYANKPLRIHDIKKNAVPFWRKMGVQFTRSDFETPIKTSSKTNLGIYGIIA